jgi:hypothetical protein
MEYLPDEILNDINRLEGRKPKPTRKTSKKQSISFVYEPEAEPSSSFMTAIAVDANNLRLVTPASLIQTKNIVVTDEDVAEPMPNNRKGEELISLNLKILEEIGASHDNHEPYPTEMVIIYIISTACVSQHYTDGAEDIRRSISGNNQTSGRSYV